MRIVCEKTREQATIDSAAISIPTTVGRTEITERVVTPTPEGVIIAKPTVEQRPERPEQRPKQQHQYSIPEATEKLNDAISLFENAEYDEAIQILKSCYCVFYQNRNHEESLNQLIKTTYYLGECHTQQANYRTAISYFEEALTLFFILESFDKPNFSKERSGLCGDERYKSVVSLFTRFSRAYFSNHTIIKDPSNPTIEEFYQFIDSGDSTKDEGIRTLKEALAFAYLHRGYEIQIQNQHQKSREYFKYAKCLATQLKDTTKLAMANFAIGRSYIFEEKEAAAISFLSSAYKLLKHNKEPVVKLQLADIAQHLGLCYQIQKNYKLAKDYLLKSLEIFSEYDSPSDTNSDTNHINMAVTSLGLGICTYLIEGSLIKGSRAADIYFDQVLKFYNSIQDFPDLVEHSLATADIWFKHLGSDFTKSINSQSFKQIFKQYTLWKQNSSKQSSDDTSARKPEKKDEDTEKSVQMYSKNTDYSVWKEKENGKGKGPKDEDKGVDRGKDKDDGVRDKDKDKDFQCQTW